MAGHAPRFSQADLGAPSWLERVSDVHLSIYMLIAAAIAAGAVYAVDARFLG